MRSRTIILAVALLVIASLAVLALPVAADAPGATDRGLDEPFDQPATAGVYAWIDPIVKFALVLAVLAAAIFIAIGAYMYFVATGNAQVAQQGKEYISRSIIGLVLALLAWVILNTISPQFTKGLKEPTLNAHPTEQGRG